MCKLGEKVPSLILFVGLGLVLLHSTASSYPEDSLTHQAIGMDWRCLDCHMYSRANAVVLLRIGGRKILELVTDGPYSIMRNPLYVFSVIRVAGIGAQAGSVTIALVCACVALVSVFRSWRNMRSDCCCVDIASLMLPICGAFHVSCPIYLFGGMSPR